MPRVPCSIAFPTMQFTTLALLALVAVAAAVSNTACPECKYAASIGPCVNLQCPKDSSCIENECVPNAAGVSAVPPPAESAVGPCILETETLCQEQHFCYAGECYPIDFSNLALNE